MRKLLLALCTPILLTLPALATSQVNFAINISSASIGVNISTYPQLVAIPGYPVYYAPRLPANYFFYDGVYWVFVNDNWYASAWYDGPWELVAPDVVPLFILRVPVRYYRRPPPYFRTWVASAPPHWGEHWGRNWEEHRRGWDRWDHADVPAPAPLPTYQRHYVGNRYPSVQQQQNLQQQNYRYRPSDAVAQRYYERQASAPPAHGHAAAPIQSTPQVQQGAHFAPHAAARTAQPAPTQAEREAGRQGQPHATQRTQRRSEEGRQSAQAPREQEQAQQRRQAEQTHRAQQQMQQRQPQQAQREQQQVHQRQAEQTHRAQPQAHQRQTQQAQREQHQVRQHQAGQAQRAEQQAQRQAQQAQRSEQHAQRQQQAAGERENRRPEGKAQGG